MRNEAAENWSHKGKLVLIRFWFGLGAPGSRVRFRLKSRSAFGLFEAQLRWRRHRHSLSGEWSPCWISVPKSSPETTASCRSSWSKDRATDVYHVNHYRNYRYHNCLEYGHQQLSRAFFEASVASAFGAIAAAKPRLANRIAPLPEHSSTPNQAPQRSPPRLKLRAASIAAC